MNLPPGDYTVTVTDQSGCPQVSDIISLTGTSSLSGTLNTVVNPTCDAAANGSIDIDVEGASLSCLLYTSPSPRDRQKSRMPSSA